MDMGVDIVFKNLSYSVEVPKKEQTSVLPCKKEMEQKQILKNVTGIFKPKEISAIIGSSGAGKTTLLNLLACRIPKKEGGELLANKTPYSYATFGDFANYVMQSDVLMQTLTVR